jgi:hypothetical protein
MFTRLLLVAALAGCATDVTADDVPGIDLDAELPPESGDGKADSASTQLVFLNFGGARITGGYTCSDAPSNCSRMVSGTQDFAPFTLSDQWDRGKVVAAITQCVGMFFADMNVRFVTTRPAAGPYTMMMIGAIYPTQLGFETNAGPYGRAPVDCGNSNKNDIGFLLLQDSVDPDFYFMCRSIAHELGHTFGMLHTSGENTVANGRVDMMCESGECGDAAATGAAKWDVINRSMPTEVTACDGTSRQNTYARLMDVLGAR